MGIAVPYWRPPRLPARERKRFLARVSHALEEGRYTRGELAAELANRIAHECGYDHGIPFGQATHAIMVLARWYRKEGFRRIVAPAFTWPSTYAPFVWSGFKVRFCDIDAKTWLAVPGRVLDLDEVLCPVDTFGSVYDRYVRNAEWVDSAQSLGSPWRDAGAGPHRVVSLSSTKVLTSAEGGILLTQEGRLDEFARGLVRWYSRMSEFHAALGLAYLNSFQRNLKAKERIADAYRDIFPDLGWQEIPVGTNHYVVAALVDDPTAFAQEHPTWEFRDYYQSILREDDAFVPIEAMQGQTLPAATLNVARHVIAFPSWPDLSVRAIREEFER